MQNFITTTYLQSIKTFIGSFFGRKLKIITTFNGIGALSEALRQLGIPTDYHTVCEIDKSANETYFYNFTANRGKRVKDIRYLEQSVQKGLNLDLLVQSSPCQSFSLAGQRQGHVVRHIPLLVEIEHVVPLHVLDRGFRAQRGQG